MSDIIKKMWLSAVMRDNYGKARMMKVTLLLVVAALLVLVSGCQNEIDVIEKIDAAPQPAPPAESPTMEELENNGESEDAEEKQEKIAEETSCKLNSDCAEGSYCIDEKCRELLSLVDSGCEAKCTVKEVAIETNDGDSYLLPPGKGDYTAAGAIDWTILKMPLQCEGKAVVALSIFKRNYNTVLGDYAIVLKEGETSEIITHPINKKVAFSLTIKEVVEEC